jgi:hypothetical protein
MSKLTSVRLGLFKIPVGIALLRSMGVAEVPENWTQESLHGMVLGVVANFRSHFARFVSLAIS